MLNYFKTAIPCLSLSLRRMCPQVHTTEATQRFGQVLGARPRPHIRSYLFKFRDNVVEVVYRPQIPRPRYRFDDDVATCNSKNKKIRGYIKSKAFTPFCYTPVLSSGFTKSGALREELR